MKLKLPKRTVDLFDEVGQVVTTSEGNTYRYFPFWIKDTKNDTIFELMSLDKLPDDLTEEIKKKFK